MKGLFAAVMSVLMMVSGLIPGGKGYYEAVKERRDNDEISVVMSVDCVERDTEEGMNNMDKITIVFEYGDADEPVGILGPEDYEVINGDTLCILDSFAHRLQFYDIETGSWLRSMDIAPCKDAVKLEYLNGMFYVFDNQAMKIYTFNEAGEPVYTIDAPEIGKMDDYEDMDDYIHMWSSVFSADLKTYDGEVYLVCSGINAADTNDYKVEGDHLVPCEPVFAYSVDDEDVVTITHGDSSWIVDCENTGISVLGSDEQGNLYMRCVWHMYDKDGLMHTATSLRVYDRYSNLVKANSFDLNDKYDVFLVEEAKWNNTETAFVLSGTADSMELSMISFDGVFTEPDIACERSNDNAANKVYNNSEPERTTYIVPAYNRYQALAVAEQYVNYTYNISYKNQHAWNSCQLHDSIANAANGTLMTGVPYAWGLWNTINTVTTRLTTVYGTYAGEQYYYCAGNINKTSDRGGSLGVDCSGYASRVYGLSEKHGSSSFVSQCHTTTTPRIMDCYAKNGHVMLFVSRTNNDTANVVYEASRTAAGIVREHTYSDNYLNNNDYVLRNPWHAGDCSTFEYHYTDTQHWRVCTICGFERLKKNHTLSGYGYNNSGHWQNCSICGYTTDVCSHSLSGYSFDQDCHWQECSVNCGYETTPEAHTMSDYVYDANAHWKVCTDGCGYTAEYGTHSWQEMNLKYWEVCSECGSTRYVGPSKAFSKLAEIPMCK